MMDAKAVMLGVEEIHLIKEIFLVNQGLRMSGRDFTLFSIQKMILLLQD
jgi:hypothetical protein